MICPHVDGPTEHHPRGAGPPLGGYLPLGTMCDQSNGTITCFDCGHTVPGGKYALPEPLQAMADSAAAYVTEHFLRPRLIESGMTPEQADRIKVTFDGTPL